MSVDEITEMGPVDYVLIEWRNERPQADAVPLLMDLVDEGTIRILDLSFMTKDENGTVDAMEMVDVAAIEGLEELVGAASGLLSHEDVLEAATVLEPGTSAALIVYENSWAAPFASTVRRNGGQLVANGRIPVQALLEAIDSAEAGS